MAIGREIDEKRATTPAPAPLPDQNGRAFSRDELAIVRRAYARQMLA